MSVVRHCSVLAFLIFCTLCVGLRHCGAVQAIRGMEDPAHFADTLAAIQKIVDKMPAESQPSDSPDGTGTTQRRKATKWLAENLVGKPVEFPVKVTQASIYPTPGIPGGKGALIQIANETVLLDGNVVIDAGKLHSGGTDWQLLIEFPQPKPRGELDDAMSEKLHQLSGQTVKVSATVSEGKKDQKGRAVGSPIFSIEKVVMARARQVLADRTLQIHLSNVSMGGLDLK